jgi:predicted HD superfamily hydrolase involved in NAD metabolism
MNALDISSGLGFCGLCATISQDIGQKHRYAHSVRVARTAELLAKQHGIDTKRARIAGLLHDIARLWSTERLLAACAERNYTPSEFELANPVILHAPIGAALARENYGIRDQGILQAIERHTVAAVDMEPLDTVVYLADALEPGRDFPERAEYFDLAMKDLKSGLIEVYSSTKSYLEQRGHKASPTLEAGLAKLLIP